MTATTHPSEHASPQAGAELRPLVEHWWMMAARGVLAVAFGGAILLWQVPVFTAVVVSFGSYAIADGVLAIASALRVGSFRRAGWAIALEGAVSVALGAIALNWPAFPQRVIDMLIVWGLGTGLMELVAAAAIPRELAARWLLATAGASSLFLAVALIVLPHANSDRAATVLAAYALVFGVAIFLASLRFRRARR